MLHDEQIVTFSEAARGLPPVNGRRLHASTIWRWARKGISGVHLETLRLCGRFVTSLEALERFSVALAEIAPNGSRAAESTTTTPKPRSDAQRAKAVAQANRELEASGI